MNNSNDYQTKNDKAWLKLFTELNILQEIEKNNEFTITAQQIKSISGREPRLMAKFDHSENLPKLFQENQLAILPITRGSYVISNLEAYHNFEEEENSISRFSLPDYIQSINVDNIFSETIALNCAFAAGIIDDFLDETNLQPTVSGRMKSGRFNFNIHNTRSKTLHNINVNNAQIEIDAAYEGANSLTIFEAKNDLSTDFLVRQLFYPFSTWRNTITKPVRSVYIVYSNGIFRLYEYGFEIPDDYNSIKLLKSKRYSVENTDISLDDIQTLDIKIVPEPQDIPFPQADDFDRIINLCELLNENQQLTRNDVTENYAFNARQTNYYTDAARYLGLIEKGRDEGDVVYKLTNQGKRILSLKYKARQLEFSKLILQHEAFNTTFQQCMEIGAMPAKTQIVNNLRFSNPQIESDSTLERRSSTIRAWLEWILQTVNRE